MVKHASKDNKIQISATGTSILKQIQEIIKGYSPEENKRFEEEARRINEERKRARSEFMIP